MIHGSFVMPYHSSLAIANEFLRRAKDDGRELTQMHLQKLVYLAHGWCLAVTGKPLIEEKIQAWDYGPVIKPLYDALKSYGSANIPRLIRWADATHKLSRRSIYRITYKPNAGRTRA